ncbi:hypothetical protein VitviT2T_028048 [Vitis vinifera]|uniref:Aldehyde dehydrogenase domain-containing protein n=1 Tax=Vitis vinifera TaxID=29760 RepID=A0ABY9DS14_VITVI|nr:hypothetical protein VitviT2T_028048 [Vitis vinifera]
MGVTEEERVDGFENEDSLRGASQDGMLIAQDHIFGPDQSILKLKDLDEVIRMVDAISYGLATGVFT